MNPPQSETQQYLKQDQAYYLQTYRRYPLVLERGEDVYVWDTDGNRYLDALAGIAVNNLGHCHPKVVEAIREQVGQLIHISNFYTSKPQAELTEALCKLSGMDRAFFSNSGAESVEGAIKLARKYAHAHGRGGTIHAVTQSFHGRTLATIAMGKKAMQEGFGPMPAGFCRLPFNDMEAVRRDVNQDSAAIIVEPVQGEGGIHPADLEYLQALRAFCDQHKLVLIFDEIQCGIGRTGRLFAKEHYGVQPDIITLAKGLGSGVPIGAILCTQTIADAINYGDHGTTFGGNPMACAAALATLEVMQLPGFLEDVREKGQMLMEALRERRHPDVVEVRGLGLMVGVEFNDETKPMVKRMMEHGVLANATAGNVLRLVPPLTIRRDALMELVDVAFRAWDETKAQAHG
jgi:acetylornithine/N-succinyldiaminopimelate aminotransferase